jgi:release factor glutamine methyltransferase
VRPAEVVRRGADYLARHDVESPMASAEQLMMLVLGTDRAGVYGRTDGLRAAEAKAFGRALCRRCWGTPLQHLTGIAGFRGLELIVRPGVFVPRPETEVLVGVALAMIDEVDRPVVVDVGTGSGAIALAIKRERPDAVVHATDTSAAAVDLARENAERLGLGVDVAQGELLASLPPEVRPELVVSNPPYVSFAEEAALQPEVLAEPREALFGEPDLYRELFDQAASRLAAGGRLAVEIHEEAASDVSRMAETAGFVDVRITKDLTRRDRVLGARLP